MSIIRSMRALWRRLWAERLRWPGESFRDDVDVLVDRMLIVKKRCEALAPTYFPSGEDQ
jgi:hypothetical protein